MSPDFPSLASPFRASFFHITDFYHYDLMPPLKTFCTRHWVGPRKGVSNRAPHLLRPALVKTNRSRSWIRSHVHEKKSSGAEAVSFYDGSTALCPLPTQTLSLVNWFPNCGPLPGIGPRKHFLWASYLF